MVSVPCNMTRQRDATMGSSLKICGQLCKITKIEHSLKYHS